MTNLNRTAMYCVNNVNHPTFKETCGANCVECNGQVGIKDVSEERYRALPSYSDLRRERKRKIEIANLGLTKTDPRYTELSREPKPNNEIEIIMTNPNNPPIIKLNGKAIEGIIELNYQYATKDEVSQGHHNFIVTYCDKETNTIRTVAINKVWEG